MTIIQRQVKSTVNANYTEPKNIENLSANPKNLKTDVFSSNKDVSIFDNPQVKKEWKNYVEEQHENFNFLTQNYNEIALSYFENWAKLSSSYYESSKTFQDICYRTFLSYLKVQTKTD
ncbi:MAG: hypothetical protein GWN01_05265 [Nitrosopumilaceae archaeon]|nr:hypothetical protein [Nitrosopumilaceae archaeon]NIU00353.1 hypothetical protein [Nitrosopumilaceae archaeon]NIU86755.1 hypothetical protein [Nitrosopumilaceae archaeon]NIV65455.1 hypothetical protein [Nitrosopumilaceae archaeon]NIX60955.1 hypothetical protein [Nitrosopumilaceae archaeon]